MLTYVRLGKGYRVTFGFKYGPICKPVGQSLTLIYPNPIKCYFENTKKPATKPTRSDNFEFLKHAGLTSNVELSKRKSDVSFIIFTGCILSLRHEINISG